MKATLVSQLERLETKMEIAKSRDPQERERDLQEFRRAAEDWLLDLRRLAPPENEPVILCSDARDKARVVQQLTTYYIEILRRQARERHPV